jgi:hypothetical protein
LNVKLTTVFKSLLNVNDRIEIPVECRRTLLKSHSPGGVARVGSGGGGGGGGGGGLWHHHKVERVEAQPYGGGGVLVHVVGRVDLMDALVRAHAAVPALASSLTVSLTVSPPLLPVAGGA